MTAVKPQVLVYQDVASQTSESPLPTLNSLIAGPCYHLRDYPADRVAIALPEYGTRTGSNDPLSLLGVVGIPASGDDAAVIASPPDNAVGALLDSSSVVIYLEDALAIITRGVDGEFGAVAPDENLFTVAGATFADDGVRPGDRLVATDSVNGITVEKLVLEVGGFGGSTLLDTQLRTQSNYTTAGTDINGDAYTGAALDKIDYRVERVLPDGTELSADYIDIVGNSVTILGGALVLDDFDGDSTETAYTLSYALMYMEYRALRQDLASIQVVTAANIDTLLGRKDSRNPLHVGVTMALANAAGRRIQAFGVTGDDLNGASDTAAAYNIMLGLLASRDDVHAITPLTLDSTVIDAVKDHCNTYSAPEKSRFRICISGWGPLELSRTIGSASIVGTAESVAADDITILTSPTFDLIADGVRAADTITICNDNAGASRIGTYAVSRVHDSLRLASDGLAGTTAATDDIKFWIFRGATGTVNRRLTAIDITAAGSTFDVPATSGTDADVGRVARLVGAVAGTNATASPNSSAEYLIISRAGDTYTVEGTFDANETLTIDVVNTLDSSVSVVSATNRKAFRRMLDNSATFVTNGAAAADVLEVPTPAGTALVDFDVVYSAVIEAVDSENRVTLVDGEDIPTLDPSVTQTTIGYRVRRSMAAPAQAANLVTAVDGAGSREEKRLVLVWPDEALLAGISNAKTGLQSREPGYYLAAAVAGMCAGVPPHQGLTRRAVSGVTTLFHTTRYFSEDDLELISNSGFFLFIQDTDTSTPYCVHQLTTDTSSVTNQELSIVRSLDYISKFIKAIVDPFIGAYNVNPATLELIAEAVRNGIEQLRSNPLPRIGAVLNDGTLDSIGVLAGAPDRVELFLGLDIPGPLNRLGVHLVV